MVKTTVSGKLSPSRLAGLVCLLVTACAQNPPPPPSITPVVPTVGTVSLQQADVTPSEVRLLDVAVQVFENRAHEDTGGGFGELVFDEIRDNETRYLPYVLRNTLIDSNQWGSVRVLPRPDPSIDLSVSGAILKTDGRSLIVHVRAVDSTGRVWLDRDYGDATIEEDYPESTRYTPGRRFDPGSFTDPFQDLYDQINNDLVTVRNRLSEAELTDIGRVSTLLYADDLSPETFGHMLAQTDAGLLTVSSLPAGDDPMFQRVYDMRLRHHLFIDTVDQYYRGLFEDMQPAYVIWRRYSYDQIEQNEAALREAYDASLYSSSGGYLTLTQRYDRYRWSKIYETEFRELATGFNREMAPAILELNKQVHGLSGTMEEQYIQWRRILRELFTLETGGN